MPTSKLVLKFGTLSGEKTWSFNNAKSDVATSSVKSFIQTMITNGSIYTYPPMTAKSAKIVTTSEDIIDLED